MPSTHLGGRELEGYESSWLIPAIVPELEGPGRLVVFIHGYGGDAVRTWSMFDLLLQQEGGLRGVDLLFYGYDARWSELVASTGLFHSFLTVLMGSPAEVLNSSLSAAQARTPRFRYLSAVICAHSLGAVLARGALLGATREHADWTKIIDWSSTLRRTAARASNVSSRRASASQGFSARSPRPTRSPRHCSIGWRR